MMATYRLSGGFLRPHIMNATPLTSDLECGCGRTFSTPGALKTHRSNCSGNRKRLSSMLTGTQNIFAARKRLRAAALSKRLATPQTSQQSTLETDAEMFSEAEASEAPEALVDNAVAQPPTVVPEEQAGTEVRQAHQHYHMYRLLMSCVAF